jgi:hypothetical protein
MSECNTCGDRRLVGGFLPAWCPDCGPASHAKPPAFVHPSNMSTIIDVLETDRDSLRSDLSRLSRELEAMTVERNNLSIDLDAYKMLGLIHPDEAAPIVAAERDRAIQERDEAIEEREADEAERADIMATINRVVNERDSARDSARMMSAAYDRKVAECHALTSSVAELKRELGRVMPVYLAAVKLYELDEADAMAGEGLSPRFPGTFAALSALYEAIDSTPKPGDS